MKKWAQYLILGLLCISLFITSFYLYKDVSNLQNMLEQHLEDSLELEQDVIDVNKHIVLIYEKIESLEDKTSDFEEHIISENIKSDIDEDSLTDETIWEKIELFYSAKNKLLNSVIKEGKLDHETLISIVELQDSINLFWEKISDYKTDNELLSEEITEKYCNAVYAINNDEYVIPAGQIAFVTWHKNIIIPESNKSFKVTRTYEVKDQTKPGYLIVEKNESRYLIVIG